ncbi:Auxin-responsive protein SAUR78 [Bienertia sinuspersici]
MDCLVVPVSVLVRRCSGRYSSSRLGYQSLADDDMIADGELVTVVVGRERRQFLVDPFVLQENPFRVLIEMAMKSNDHHENYRKELENYMKGITSKTCNNRVIFVDVDAILFEHMLWLLYNDCSSFFKLNVKEIMDFYAQDY